MASRSGFKSRFGFIAAAAGSAVGLGNIWGFPYQTGENGGAAFLIIYLVCIVLIGYPIMVGEIAIGRSTLKNPYGAYKQLGGKAWALVGFFGVLCGVMILSFYNVIAGWAFGYFLNISFNDLLSETDYGAFFGEYVKNVGPNLLYSALFMVLTAFIVVRGIQNGIEAAAKVMMPLLFALLLGLIIYSLTLNNASDGVSFYLKPDFSKVNLTTIYSAMGQAFFSLSLGMGALITYGSYISKKENIISAAGIVTAADTSVAFLAGLLIFPLVFSQGITPAQGPGLLFVALPGVFNGMAGIGVVVGAIFFFLISLAALTSTISLLEVPVSFLVDEMQWSRTTSVIVIAALVYLVGMPTLLSQGAVAGLSEFVVYEGSNKAFMDLIIDVFNEIGLPLGGCLMSIFIAYKWRTTNLSEEISSGNPNYKGSFMEGFLNVMISYICPVLLAIIVMITILQKFLGITVIA